MKLTNVARASLNDDLLPDYDKTAPELAANAMICTINLAAYLLKRQIESQGRAFMQQGGFTGNLYPQRTLARSRGKREQSDQSDGADGPDDPERSGKGGGGSPALPLPAHAWKLP